MSRAWVLNLDAEMELEGGPRYQPTAAVRARTIELARTIALPDRDRVIDPLGQSIEGCDRGRAWCPTPRAIATLARAGLAIEAPPLEVLRRVNERGFAHALSEGELEGALRATSVEEIEAHLARPGPAGAWLLKRALGVAGRGQRPIHPGPIGPDDRRWIAASLARGALYVEPRVPIERELSVHGWATVRAVSIRSIRAQTIRERAWIASEPARDLDPGIERALIDRAEQVGRALIEAGYHGPFGVDAYLWRSASAIQLRTLSEINARYCMGWDARDGWDPPE